MTPEKAMPSTKIIKQRIKSVKNTSQITKAMEVVSATKMRRSQEFALRARPYARSALALLKNILGRAAALPALLTPRPPGRSLIVAVTSDKGLAGALNANVLRNAAAWIAEKESSRASWSAIAVGKKAKEYFERRGAPAEASFTGFGDYTTLEETRPIASIVIQGFLDRRWDEVWVVYTNFRSTLAQETARKKILPASVASVEEVVKGILPERGRFAYVAEFAERQKYNYEYAFEPSPEAVLEPLAEQLLRMHIHHIILESNASEHSARMVAMKNASENARELIGTLTLQYNKARQAAITQELVEITAGREALES